MIRSLSTAVSGLRNQQTRIDVIGNNVANVNTIAFKSGRVTFEEGFAQIMGSATRPAGGGGTNPSEIGLGSQVGSIDRLFTQGSFETTGQTTDLAVQGNAFFTLSNGAQHFYSRAGNFQLDANGNLVASNGYHVQGRMATNGVLADSLTNVTLPLAQKVPATATKNVTLSGNLDASAAS